MNAKAMERMLTPRAVAGLVDCAGAVPALEDVLREIRGIERQGARHTWALRVFSHAVVEGIAASESQEQEAALVAYARWASGQDAGATGEIPPDVAHALVSQVLRPLGPLIAVEYQQATEAGRLGQRDRHHGSRSPWRTLRGFRGSVALVLYFLAFVLLEPRHAA